MASLIERRRRGGTGFQVRWRQDGTWQSDTFGTRRQALRFKCDVEDAGNAWPPGWVPGYGYGGAPAVPVAPVAVESVGTPFVGFAERYLNTRVSVAGYQMTRYKAMVRLLAPYFDCVEDVDDRSVACWIRARLAAGAAAKTIANYHGLLFAVCAYAVAKGVLAANPCVGTRLPRADGFNADGDPVTCFLEPGEFALIAEAMSEIGTPADRDLITLAVHTGLRWGELVALRVGDLNLVTRTLSVRRALKRDDTGQWVFGPPKTARSRRSISLAPELVDLMRPHLVGRQSDELVFFNGFGNPIRQNNFYGRRRQPAVRLARTRGLTKSPRFHDLRHTHVAWLVAGNTPLPKIQQRLGHESIKTTIDVYGGLLRDTDDQLDAVVPAAFAAAQPGRRLRAVPATAVSGQLAGRRRRRPVADASGR